MGNWPWIINPRSVGFSIFWLPIFLPIIIIAIGLAVEFKVSSREKQKSTENYNIREGVKLLAKNANFAFISTDMWALTSIFLAGARDQLESVFLAGLGFGVIIALLVHLFFFVSVSAMPSKSWTTLVCLVFLVIGFIGIIMVRSAIFNRIEYKNLVTIPVIEKIHPALEKDKPD